MLDSQTSWKALKVTKSEDVGVGVGVCDGVSYGVFGGERCGKVECLIYNTSRKYPIFCFATFLLQIKVKC